MFPTTKDQKQSNTGWKNVQNILIADSQKSLSQTEYDLWQKITLPTWMMKIIYRLKVLRGENGVWGVSQGSVIVGGGVRNSQKGDCVCEKVRGESGQGEWECKIRVSKRAGRVLVESERM